MGPVLRWRCEAGGALAGGSGRRLLGLSFVGSTPPTGIKTKKKTKKQGESSVGATTPYY